MISVVVINSRGSLHPDWVQTSLSSIKNQTLEDIELILIENLDRKKTIGQCWNEGVAKATKEFVLFCSDDDWIAMDLSMTLIQYAMSFPNHVNYSTFMTAYDEDTKLYAPIQRQHTGMWRRDYLLKYPFNEELKKGIDREYVEEMRKRGDTGIVIQHYFGYYYRKHTDYSCSGKIIFTKELSDIYVLTTSRNFIDPIVNEWRKTKKVFVSGEPFDRTLADNAKIIFCEWLTEKAREVAEYECKAKKYLRIHSYEIYTPLIYYTDFSKFDKIFFIAEHVKEYVESKIGELPNAVVIPNAVELLPFIEKEKNNKICYAGEISRKKGIGELFLIAKEFPEMEFHIAGKFKEEDVARYFKEKKPDNVFLEPYSYDLKEFFKDKTYFINTSLREGNPVTVIEAMSAGLKPLINDWVGADKIYGKYVFKNLLNLRQMLNEYVPKEYREFAEQYEFNKIFEKINYII